MLTLSKPISAGQAQANHRSEFANAKENYYTEGERVRGCGRASLPSAGASTARLPNSSSSS